MDRRFVIAFLVSTLFNAFQIEAQSKKEVIHLQNPSFEDIVPRQGQAPPKWFNCGEPSESPPDVQPGKYNVVKNPKHGNTYLGLVARDNGSHECVSQRLSTHLKAGSCYKFNLWLCRSEIYLSKSSVTLQDANYSTPCVINIYGGSDYSVKTQLLSVSKEISNIDWKESSFELKPNQDISYIIIEASHKKPVLFPYNGNILVDFASDIVPIKCEEKQIAKVNKPKKLPDTSRRTDAGGIASINSKIPEAYDKPVAIPTVSAYDRRKMRVGQTIRIEKLYFDADSTNLKRNSYPVLDELYQFMSSNTDVNIEVGGHTNDIPSDAFCDKLSSTRARAVAEYLIMKGIHESRVQYHGYGKRNPLFPNVTQENRKRNQRVEIKILSIGL